MKFFTGDVNFCIFFPFTQTNQTRFAHLSLRHFCRVQSSSCSQFGQGNYSDHLLQKPKHAVANTGTIEAGLHYVHTVWHSPDAMSSQSHALASSLLQFSADGRKVS